ncbi:MAG: glycosyltransferase [Longimicrobiales bacterium]
MSALSRRDLDITLCIPKLGPVLDGPAIRQFYHTSGAFAVHHYAPLKHPRVAQKIFAAFRVSSSRLARQADVLYTRNLPIAALAVGRGLPTLFESYRPWPDQYPVLTPIIRRMTRAPSFIGGVFHSELARDSHTRAGAPPERLLVAHNGYEPARMAPVLSKGQARETLAIDKDRPTVVYTGRVATGKGLETVLRVAQECPDVRFVLVGATGTNPLEGSFEASANVSFAPWQPYDKVSRWLYAADVLIVPPSSAPLEEHGHTVLPMKLFSYLAAGRPILAPSTPDIGELLINGKNAVLVAPGDTPGAAQSLKTLLADPTLQERLSKGALKTAAALTWDARAARIHEFLIQRLERHT